MTAFFKEHPEFIQPDGRMNEMLKNSSSQAWKTWLCHVQPLPGGVKVPSDPKHVVYVCGLMFYQLYITALWLWSG